MTLQEHLCDAGCYSEVAVNLEWWMGIEEIRIGSSIRILLCLRIRWQQAKHIADDSESMIAIDPWCALIGVVSVVVIAITPKLDQFMDLIDKAPEEK